MGRIKIGKVAFTPKGVYDSSVSYAKYDMVFHELMAYISNFDGNINNELTDTSAWTPFIGVMQVDGTMLAPGCVTTDKLQSYDPNNPNDTGVITTKIADGAVTTEKIQNGAVNSDKIVNGSITTEKIANGTILSEDIGNGQIHTENIANGAVGTNQLDQAAVTTDKISGSWDEETQSWTTLPAVTTDKIADHNVTTEKLSGGLYGSEMTLPCVTKEKIAKGAVTTDKLSSAASIQGAAVTTEKIEDRAVKTEKIDNLAVTTEKIEDYDSEADHPTGVTTAKIADEAVTTKKLESYTVAGTGVTTAKIHAGAVTTEKIAYEAVTTEKLEDYDSNADHPTGVTTDKLSGWTDEQGITHDAAVTSAKIHDEAVTSAKIADGAVTHEKIQDYAVAAVNIGNGEIKARHISGSDDPEGPAITSDKFDADALAEYLSVVDEVPTSASMNPISSDGVYTALSLLASGAKAQLVASPAVVCKGVETDIALTGSVVNAGTVSSITIKDGSTVIATDTTGSTSVSGTAQDEEINTSKTFSLECVTAGMTFNAIATVQARKPIYAGFGAQASSVKITDNRHAALSAAGRYEGTASEDGQYYFILVPTSADVTDVSHFVMNGAPFEMQTTSDTIGSDTYSIHRSKYSYNSGTTLNIVAS